jgi:undecaprenyl-diphosphatase
MNQQIFFFFYNFAHQSTLLDQIIIFFAQYFPYIVVFLAGIFLVMHHEIFKTESTWQVFLQKKREILSVFFDGALAWLLARLLKSFFHILRPAETFSQVKTLILEKGYAFPSGHATFFMALAFAIFFFHRKAGYTFIFFALLIGLARIMAGVHFPLDILGGFVFGGLVAFSLKNIYSHTKNS